MGMGNERNDHCWESSWAIVCECEKWMTTASVTSSLNTRQQKQKTKNKTNRKKKKKKKTNQSERQERERERGKGVHIIFVHMKQIFEFGYDIEINLFGWDRGILKQ